MKESLSTGPYCLPRLQEIVVIVAIANILLPYAAPKENQN
jgi:hypothetical protein